MTNAQSWTLLGIVGVLLSVIGAHDHQPGSPSCAPIIDVRIR